MSHSHKANGPRALTLFAAALLFVGLFAGCASMKEEQGVRRGPQELYETAMDAYVARSYEKAESTFKELLEEYPLSPYSTDAQLMLGDVCFAREKYEEAASYFTSFAALHPSHPRASYALFQKGMSHFKEVLAVDRDQTSTRKALFAFEDLVAVYPGSPYHDKAAELIGFLTRRLAERELYVGRFYFKGKNYRGALGRFRDVIEKYPDSGLTDQTLFLIGESYRRLGEQELAEDAFTTLVTEFPESPYSEDARKELSGG